VSRPAFQGRPAGVVSRALACGIDGLVVVGLLVLAWGSWAAFRFLLRPASFTMPSPSWAFVLGAGAVVSIVYLTVCWATSGRSYGDQVLGLRVTSRASGRLGWVRSAARAAAYVAFPLGLAWSAFDSSNRSLQDLVVRSRVVYDWIPRVPS
jgi:uncharacterized RDD family membrane protein YckC